MPEPCDPSRPRSGRDSNLRTCERWRAADDRSSVSCTMAIHQPHSLGMLGRRKECEALDRLLADVHVGQSRVLVLRGEAGVGKTALLEYLLDGAVGMPHRASGGCRVRDGAPVRRLAPVVRADPGPARSSARAAARRAGHGVRAAARRAARSLPRRLWPCSACSPTWREERPLVCVVDDAQWLDRASAQTLGVRRPPPAGRVGRPGVRGAGPQRRRGPRRASGAGDPRAGDG